MRLGEWLAFAIVICLLILMVALILDVQASV